MFYSAAHSSRFRGLLMIIGIFVVWWSFSINWIKWDSHEEKTASEWMLIKYQNCIGRIHQNMLEFSQKQQFQSCLWMFQGFARASLWVSECLALILMFLLNIFTSQPWKHLGPAAVVSGTFVLYISKHRKIQFLFLIWFSSWVYYKISANLMAFDWFPAALGKWLPIFL